MSFSRRAFLGPSPSLVIDPAPCVATRRLPTPDCVSRTSRDFHPTCPHGGLWPDSRVRISRPGGRRHLFGMLRLARSEAPHESFSVAPHRHAGRLDRVSRLLSGGSRGLLAQASIEPDKPFSWHPALRATCMTGDKPRPLSQAGEAWFTGRTRPTEMVSGTALSVH